MMECRKCYEDKEPEDFYANRATKSGRDTWCKTCRREYNHNYFAKHPDYQRDYYYRITKQKRQEARRAKEQNQS